MVSYDADTPWSRSGLDIMSLTSDAVYSLEQECFGLYVVDVGCCTLLGAGVVVLFMCIHGLIVCEYF